MKDFLLFLHKKNLQFKSRHNIVSKSRPVSIYRSKLQNYIIRKYSSNCITVEGRKLMIDPDQMLREMILHKEGKLTKLARKFLKNGDIVLDLGANIGFFTCLYADIVGEEGHVFAFEPEPHNFSLLKKNIEINGYRNVTVEQLAVAEKTQKTKLYLSKNPVDHSIYFRDYDPRETIDIQAISLDDYFKDSNIVINYVKSNMQGADFPAFLGMTELIKKSEKIIMTVEYYPQLIRDAKLQPDEFIKKLHNFGFKLYDLGGWNTNKIKIENLKEITKESSNSLLPSMGILCIKSH